jgi:hypothetical protein
MRRFGLRPKEDSQAFTRVHHRAISPTTTDENVGEQ